MVPLGAWPVAVASEHDPGLLPGPVQSLTIDPLPPDHQSSESTEKEDTAHHCLPLVGVKVHLLKGLVELEPVHWREVGVGKEPQVHPL